MIRDVFLRTEFNYDMDLATLESGLKCEDPTLTQQHMADECDINVIAEKFGLTGSMPTNVVPPMQGDFEGAMDFQSSLDVIRAADAAFMEMPAKVRSRFDNDPGKFLEFAYDANNREEAIALGLVLPPPPPPGKVEPIEVRVVAPTPPGQTSS